MARGSCKGAAFEVFLQSLRACGQIGRGTVRICPYGGYSESQRGGKFDGVLTVICPQTRAFEVFLQALPGLRANGRGTGRICPYGGHSESQRGGK